MTEPRSDAQDSVESTLTQWAEEALELRHGEAGDPLGKIGLPAYELGQYAVVEMLQRVRVRLDRVEELQSKARQVKGRMMRMRESAEFDASLAFDTALHTNRSTRVQEYVTGAEKNADAALASLEEKRRAHQMKRKFDLSVEVLDVISQCYWGLEKLREELLQMLKLHTFLTSEETQTSSAS